MILDFGDTAAMDRQITADMRHAGGYYILARAGRFTIWASRVPEPGGIVSVTEPSAATVQPPGMYLPSPPDGQEKYGYFGKPRRWVFGWLLIASLGVLYGYVRVAQHAWAVAPLMWLLLMVMVPPIAVNFWLRIGRPRLTLADHQATVASYREHGETVDVFLPSCGEPLAVLDNTFRYVSAMRWGGRKTVYALDDSVREQVRDLADQYGFRYVVRPNPGEMKKAGNLTHALGVSDGDFIAVIDADFAVRPEFLYETMPYFSDPKVGIVQTAQFFDVTNRAFSYIQRYAGTLQEIFFHFIQPPGTGTRPRSARAPTWSTAAPPWSPRAASRRCRSGRTCTPG